MILSGVPPALFACFLPLGLFVGQCSETKVPTSQREWTQFLGRTVRAWVGADALSRMKCDSYYLCMRWGVSGYRVQASSSITFSLRWNSLMHSMNQLGLDWIDQGSIWVGFLGPNSFSLFRSLGSAVVSTVHLMILKLSLLARRDKTAGDSSAQCFAPRITQGFLSLGEAMEEDFAWTSCIWKPSGFKHWALQNWKICSMIIHYRFDRFLTQQVESIAKSCILMGLVAVSAILRLTH